MDDLVSGRCRDAAIRRAAPGAWCQRNLLVYKHTWMVIFSGFFEPLFYLLSIGIGIGALVPDVNGVSYAAFVAPGLLASSCMNGAISDGMFNIFFKLHFQKTYDGILATPMRVPDVAFGEMLWALTRGSIYAGAFLIVVLALGELRGPRILLSPSALLAFPAAVLVAASFSAMALCLTSFIRKVRGLRHGDGAAGDADVSLQRDLLSGDASCRWCVQWLFQIVPLFHAVELLRALTTGAIGEAIWWHVAFLVGGGLCAFVVAMRRLERALIK